MVSPGNCLALGDPNTILYAPDGSTVSSDGGGFTLDGREFRMGEPIKGGFSGLLLPFEDVPDPSQVLIDCNPEQVVMLFQEADDAAWG